MLFIINHFKKTTVNSLKPYVFKYFQCSTNVINSTLSKLHGWNLIFIKKEMGIRAYFYSLTEKGFLLLKHPIFHNYLANLRIISNLKDCL